MNTGSLSDLRYTDVCFSSGFTEAMFRRTTGVYGCFPGIYLEEKDNPFKIILIIAAIFL